MGGPTLAERDRRWRLLDEAMAAAGFDALILVGNDYRGHKGSLRYVADFDLGHRHGTAVKPRGGEAFLVLPGNLGAQRLDRRWVSDIRFPRRLSAGLVSAVKGMPWARTIGIVGRDQVMRVEDHEALREAFPRVTFPDASRLFDEVRVTKSAEELVGVEESAYILDRCFDRLLEIARPGATEREIGAEMYRVAHSLGGEDTLFLTMHTGEQGSGRTGVTWGVPRDRVLRSSDVFTFSFEVTGPRGYWTEFSRMVTFQRPTEAVDRMASAVAAGISAATAALAGGVDDPLSVQDEVLAAAGRHGVTSGYWSGHSIGLDVLEEPMIGADVVEDGATATDAKPIACGPGSVLAVHPMLWDAANEVTGYLADTVVVETGACRTLSTHPTQLFCLPGGAA